MEILNPNIPSMAIAERIILLNAPKLMSNNQ